MRTAVALGVSARLDKDYVLLGETELHDPLKGLLAQEPHHRRDDAPARRAGSGKRMSSPRGSG